MHSENERMGSGRAPAHRPPNRSWILRHRFRTLCVSRSTPLVGSLAEPETSCATASHPTLTSSASSSTRQRLMHRSVQRHQQCLPIGTSQVRRMEPARNPLRQTLIDLPISGCAHKVIERSHSSRTHRHRSGSSNFSHANPNCRSGHSRSPRREVSTARQENKIADGVKHHLHGHAAAGRGSLVFLRREMSR